MEITPIIKEAAAYGIACGVIAMAAALLILVALVAMRSSAGNPQPWPTLPFGFSAT